MAKSRLSVVLGPFCLSHGVEGSSSCLNMLELLGGSLVDFFTCWCISSGMAIPFSSPCRVRTTSGGTNSVWRRTVGHEEAFGSLSVQAVCSLACSLVCSLCNRVFGGVGWGLKISIWSMCKWGHSLILRFESRGQICPELDFSLCLLSLFHLFAGSLPKCPPKLGAGSFF